MASHHSLAGVSAICLLLTLAGHREASVHAQAQPTRDPRAAASRVAAGTASVTGAVVVAGSGLPARKARVSLSGAELRGSRSTTTDDQGRFSFVSLPAGRYSLTASKPGHVSVTYGQRQPGGGRPGTPIELSEGQKFDARLQLPRGGVITGTIVDELGEPTPGTQVRVLRYVFQNGTRTLQGGSSATTDDRGIYRVYGLQPGEYVVCATPRNATSDADRLRQELTSVREVTAELAGADRAQAEALAQRAAALQAQMAEEGDEPLSGYAPVCYPGTTATGMATPVALGVSEERAGVDFPLQMVALARIEGVVLNATGAPVQNMQVTLVSTSDMPGIGNNSARPDAEGRFRISNVAPGQYRLVARASVNPRAAVAQQPPTAAQARAAVMTRPAEPTRLWAAADVSVEGRAVSNVMLSLQQGITISGHVAFDGTTSQPPADLTRLRVMLSPVVTASALRELASGATGRVDASGRFSISNVMPGRYRLGGGAGGSGWTIESAVIGGQDTADFPIDIKGDQNLTGATLTFTDRQTELEGAVMDDRGQPATEYTIVVYPADQRYWTPGTRRIQTARPTTRGQFTFRSLPPGDYRLATVIDPEPGTWLDPAFLQQLDTASLRITLAPGEKKVQNVRMAGS